MHKMVATREIEKKFALYDNEYGSGRIIKWVFKSLNATATISSLR